MITPSILSTEITLGNGHVERLINGDDLKIDAKTPMWVDGFMFTIRGRADGVNPYASRSQGASLIDTELTFAGEKINPQPTPLLPVCAPRDRLAGVRTNVLFTADPGVVERQTWRFCKPLFVEPGQSFGGRIVKHGVPGATSLFDFLDTFIRIDIFGRAVPTGTPAPRELHLPFASGYRGPLWDATAARTATDQTDDSDLANPYQTPLFIDYLGGRAMLASSDVGGDVIDSAAVGFRPAPMTLANNVGLRISDSFGNGILRDSVPLSIAIPWTKRAWKMKTIMPPRSFFLGYLDVATPALLSGAGAFVGNAQIQLALVGYRKIAL